MNNEEDEFRRIEAEALRRAAGDDGIIRMAREAGFERVVAIHSDGSKTVTVAPVLELEAFAALVAAAEREACETAVEDIARQYQKAHEVSAENVADACAYAIRARGEQS